jgi:hypothetical protein
MKLIAQIAAGIILGWLGIQAITVFEARVVLGRAAQLPQGNVVPVQPALPKLPAAANPPVSVTAPPPYRPAPKPCEITKANGTTVRCQGPLTDPQ